jgi:hypothetical protein
MMAIGKKKLPCGSGKAAGDGLVATSKRADYSTVWLVTQAPYDPNISAALESVQVRIDVLGRLALTDAAHALLWYERYLLARQVKARIEHYALGGDQ